MFASQRSVGKKLKFKGQDIPVELLTHNSGKGAKYTRARRPVKLVYYEKFENKGDALRREIEFKKLSRAEKESLINTFKK